MVKPGASVKFNPAKSANFRAGQIPGGFAPAYKPVGFTFAGSSTKRASTIISKSTETNDEYKDPNNMDKLIQDAFPEAEMDEILEEQRKSEVK